MCNRSIRDKKKTCLDRSSVHELILATLRLQSDINMRGRLLENVLLVGGSSMFPGLAERLLQEIRECSPWVAPGKKRELVKVYALPDRGVLTWCGGAALAECDVFRQLWTTKEDYRAHGASAIHRTFI